MRSSSRCVTTRSSRRLRFSTPSSSTSLGHASSQPRPRHADVDRCCVKSLVVAMLPFVTTGGNEASHMNEVTLAPVEPTPGEMQYLEDRIYEFNSTVTAIDDGELLAFFVRDNDRIVAGLWGNTWGGTCELRQFGVDQLLPLLRVSRAGAG